SGSNGGKSSRVKAKTPKPLTESEKAAGPPEGRVPICPACKTGILKPDGIYFGEALNKPVLKKSIKQSLKSKVVIMVGTRGEVDPAAKLPLMAKKENKAKIVEVNIGKTRLSAIADVQLLGAAGDILPKLLHLVKLRMAKLILCGTQHRRAKPAKPKSSSAKAKQTKPKASSAKA
ncbi:unnamed protein product, partial [Polarella glacialis]